MIEEIIFILALIVVRPLIAFVLLALFLVVVCYGYDIFFNRDERREAEEG